MFLFVRSPSLRRQRCCHLLICGPARTVSRNHLQRQWTSLVYRIASSEATCLSRRSLPCVRAGVTGMGALTGMRRRPFLCVARLHLLKIFWVVGTLLRDTTHCLLWCTVVDRILRRGYGTVASDASPKAIVPASAGTQSGARVAYDAAILLVSVMQSPAPCLGKQLHDHLHHLHPWMLPRLVCLCNMSQRTRPSYFAPSFVIALRMLGVSWRERRPPSANSRMCRLCLRCPISRLDPQRRGKQASMEISPLVLDFDRRCCLCC